MPICGNCGTQVEDGVAVCPRCGAVVEASTLISPDAVDPQRVLLDRYIVLALLGRGGIGAVYPAKDTKLDELVALKALPQEFAADLRAIEWMKEEVRLARSLAHPAIMRVYDLQATSSCIDAGNNSYVPAGVTTDLDGNPRIVDGGSGAATVNMGAYERQP